MIEITPEMFNIVPNLKEAISYDDFCNLSDKKRFEKIFYSILDPKEIDTDTMSDPVSIVKYIGSKEEWVDKAMKYYFNHPNISVKRFVKYLDQEIIWKGIPAPEWLNYQQEKFEE